MESKALHLSFYFGTRNDVYLKFRPRAAKGILGRGVLYFCWCDINTSMCRAERSVQHIPNLLVIFGIMQDLHPLLRSNLGPWLTQAHLTQVSRVPGWEPDEYKSPSIPAATSKIVTSCLILPKDHESRTTTGPP